MLPSTLILFSNKDKVAASLCVTMKQRPLTAVQEFIYLFVYFRLADSGVDPAEWAAKLEDRFYNNHAFKATTVPSVYTPLSQPVP